MHFVMILVGLSVALWLRLQQLETGDSWENRWQRALTLFLGSPLLLVMTAIAVLSMGPHGRMVFGWEGWLSYDLAIGFLSVAILLLLKLTWDGRQTLHKTRSYASVDLKGNSARLLSTSDLYSARIGFWQPELVISQGLLDTLDEAHLDAVLIHEQAHIHYRDTFWFFWLGWIRRLTVWLPQTDRLWEELLVLRELRADRWAAQRVDPLTLAESLLLVVSAPLVQSEICAAFSSVRRDRLTERINALLDAEAPSTLPNFWSWAWLFWVCLPLAAVPFHS